MDGTPKFGSSDIFVLDQSYEDFGEGKPAERYAIFFRGSENFLGRSFPYHGIDYSGSPQGEYISRKHVKIGVGDGFVTVTGLETTTSDTTRVAFPNELEVSEQP